MTLDAASEFDIHFVQSPTVTTSLVLMSRTDFENKTRHQKQGAIERIFPLKQLSES